ncbi:hypothetical protein BOTBODRAFT_25889 [Botryobasidium botryosum FD-172 SS1]|uniref:Uncharacterized protein n=1 Tax=Botryobasidium botryosum (strain FD-172 SS1) TaxID=930990 RepID=A0A067NBF3_BOTB1|nr:hypothetical protein BOTBODRAFT_25889 [Botryobasidium botryosum FD-172 SS1]
MFTSDAIVVAFFSTPPSPHPHRSKNAFAATRHPHTPRTNPTLKYTAMSTNSAPTSRVIPGAPPPAPPSKSQQKKKRKNAANKSALSTPDTHTIPIPDPKAAALVEKAPSNGEIADELVAKDSEIAAAVASDEAPKPEEKGEDKKSSNPIIELVNKRLRTITKKLKHISLYAHKPDSELNEDQKRTRATLPGLEASHKELEEMKKNLETYFEQQAKETEARNAEVERAVQARIGEAVEYAESRAKTRTHGLLSFLTLANLLSSPNPFPQPLIITDAERAAVISAAALLTSWQEEIGESQDVKDSIVKGIVTDVSGEFQGVEYSRIRQIVSHFIHPPTPIPSPSLAPVADDSAIPTEEPLDEPAVVISSTHIIAPGGLHFMLESELETAPGLDPKGTETTTPISQGLLFGTQEATPDWEDVQVPVQPENAGVYSGDVEKLVEEEQETLQSEKLQAATLQISITEPVQAIENVIPQTPLDWAADDADELPEIENLQEQFGRSGLNTPIEPSHPTPLPPVTPQQQQPPADDGFQPVRSGRARGGFRGDGFRGGDRGRGQRGDGRGFRGGRGRGGYGPPPNGANGEYHGNGFGSGWRTSQPPGPDGEGWTHIEGRGGYRGNRGRGNFDGGDGDFRGRRARGGGFRGNKPYEPRGGVPPPHAPAPAPTES